MTTVTKALWGTDLPGGHTLQTPPGNIVKVPQHKCIHHRAQNNMTYLKHHLRAMTWTGLFRLLCNDGLVTNRNYNTLYCTEGCHLPMGIKILTNLDHPFNYICWCLHIGTVWGYFQNFLYLLNNPPPKKPFNSGQNKRPMGLNALLTKIAASA